MDKLEKCPFYGGKAKHYTDYTGHELVQCDGCGISTLHVREKAEAIAAWNRRADGWVKCSERMPEAGQDALVLDKFGTTYSAKYSDVDGEMYFVTEHDTGDDYAPITHWQPLPEPPVEP